MNKLEFPQSLKTYFDVKSPEGKAVKTAINSLISKLDGDNMPDVGWDEARQYNQALLMAAQIRADYVEFLFTLWEETFGKAGARALGEPYFGWGQNPSEIWTESFILLTFYRNGSPDDCGPHDDLYVSFENETVQLRVWRYANDDTPVNVSSGSDLKSWIPNDDDGHIGLQTKAIPMSSFIENFDSHLVELKTAAEEIVAFLKG